MDIFDKLNIDQSPLGHYAHVDPGYFMFPKLEGEISPRMTFRGTKVLNWSLNNYLGLANHPEVRKVDAEAAKEWGLAYPMGARIMSGNTVYHEQLEIELAKFVKKESGLLLNYGYQGIMSIIDTLVNRKDVIVYDAESHACIIDGVRLHLGKRFVYPHNDIESLEKQLVRAEKNAKESGGGILVITEGVFGMSGNVGNLKSIVALKEKFKFRLLVDDAHGFGTMGPTGAGVAEMMGVEDGVDLIFSTFAKSMASIGAFVAGPYNVIEFLRYNIRSQIFAKSLPTPIVIGNLKRLELLRTRPELRENLWTIVNNLQNGLRERGFNIGTTKSPVTPVFLSGGIVEAGNLIVDIREKYKIFCSVVIFPIVPRGVILLRLIPTAAHTMEDVNETIAAFEAISVKLKNGKYQHEGIESVINN
ncbi:MAG: pyridoxal phosphate-dependent aminotransferase family protein [Cyclobacteriaceae bacterium]|nr:pyridoxal phosphate-dependent aminotransferase family protein [Cyclobacteriaceae bacterium]